MCGLDGDTRQCTIPGVDPAEIPAEITGLSDEHEKGREARNVGFSPNITEIISIAPIAAVPL